MECDSASDNGVNSGRIVRLARRCLPSATDYSYLCRRIIDDWYENEEFLDKSREGTYCFRVEAPVRKLKGEGERGFC